jgi:hypothetical protein
MVEGLANQREMALMQCAHGGHEGDARAFLSPMINGETKIADGADNF